MTEIRGRARVALVLLCTAVFLDSMDLSLMGVALPSVQHELSLSEGTLQWLISGYAVTYGGFLLLGGRLADLLGRRRMFMLSLTVFAVASLAGGLFSDGALLVATRIVKGLAAALTAPAALSLITTTFTEQAQRTRALGVYSLAGATGYTGGLVLSGLLTDVSWRLVFFLPVPLALLVVALAPLVIPRSVKQADSARGFDGLGAATVTGGVLLVVYALSERDWAAGVVAVLLLVAFVFIEHRHRNPLVPLAVFRIRTVRAVNTAALAWACATIGWQFAAVLHLQQTLHYDALATGLGIAPMGLAIVFAANLAGRLIARWGLGRVAALGMLVQACGILLFLRADATSGYLTVLLPALLIHGIGNGLSFPSLNIAAVRDLPEHQQGLASGLITSAVQIGAGVGVAVLATLLTTPGLAGYRFAFLTASCFSLIGALVAALGIRTATATRQPTPTRS